MIVYVEKKLKNPSTRVLASFSPANLTVKEDGSIITKNSARIRLMIDKTLLENSGLETDRLTLVRFDHLCVGLVFKADGFGVRAAPIKKGSGRLDLSVPINHKTAPDINPNNLPRLKKAQCEYKIVGDLVAILLPLSPAIRLPK